MMAGFKPSPGEAAKFLSARQPDLQGDLTIVGLTPGGRGGWRTKAKRTQFWLDRGVAYLHRSVRSDRLPSFPYAQNGPCVVCGAYEKAPTRVKAYAPDPAPGTRIADVFGGFGGTPRFAAEFAYVTACPDCVAHLGLAAKSYGETHRTEYTHDEANHVRGIAAYHDSRPHPDLWKYSPMQYVADIIKVQQGSASLDVVEIKAGEPEPRWWEVLADSVAKDTA